MSNSSDNIFVATVAPSSNLTTGAEGGRFGLILDQQTLVIAILVGVMCCVIAILIGVVSPYFSPRWEMPPDTSHSTRRDLHAEVDPERIKRRHTTVKNWLITKTVQAHDGNCLQATTLSPPPSPIKRLQQHDDEQPDDDEDNDDDNEQPSLVKDAVDDYPQSEQDNESEPVEYENEPELIADQKEPSKDRNEPIVDEKECINNDQSETINDQNEPIRENDNELLNANTNHTHQTNNGYYAHECHICMEEFKVNDEVSWGSSCNHVYHHICIQEWLLKKRACPDCRSIMLPIDVPGVLRLSTNTNPATTTRRNNNNDATSNNGSQHDRNQITINNNEANNNNANNRNDSEQDDNEERDTKNIQIMNDLMKTKQQREESTFFCVRHGLQFSTRAPIVNPTEVAADVSVQDQDDMAPTITMDNEDTTGTDTNPMNDEIQPDPSVMNSSNINSNETDTTTTNNNNNNTSDSVQNELWVIEPPIEDRRRPRPEPPIDEENGGRGGGSSTNMTVTTRRAILPTSITTMTMIFTALPTDVQSQITDTENPSTAAVPRRSNSNNNNTGDDDDVDAGDEENQRSR